MAIPHDWLEEELHKRPPPLIVISGGGNVPLWLLCLLLPSGADLGGGEELLVGFAQTWVA